jgi:hypothetical protein
MSVASLQGEEYVFSRLPMHSRECGLRGRKGVPGRRTPSLEVRTVLLPSRLPTRLVDAKPTLLGRRNECYERLSAVQCPSLGTVEVVRLPRDCAQSCRTPGTTRAIGNGVLTRLVPTAP